MLRTTSLSHTSDTYLRRPFSVVVMMDIAAYIIILLCTCMEPMQQVYHKAEYIIDKIPWWPIEMNLTMSLPNQINFMWSTSQSLQMTLIEVNNKAWCWRTRIWCCVLTAEQLGQLTYEQLLAEGEPEFEWQVPTDEWQAIALNYTSGLWHDWQS